MASSTASPQRPGEAGGAPGAAAPDARARLRRRLVRNDLILLVGAALIVIASAVLTPSDSAVTLLGWELPPLCMWKNMTGMDCPGCGLTRSFTYMGHGRLGAAFDRHWLGPLLYGAVALQIPWRLLRLVRTLRGGDPPRRAAPRG